MKRVVAFFLLLAAPAFAADLSVTAANVAASSTAKLGRGICGATITTGQPVYLDSSNSSRVTASDSDTAPASKIVGIALGGCSSGQEVSYAREDSDFAPGATTTAGLVYVVSASTGAIAPYTDLASGKYTAVVGVGKAGNKLVLKPFAAGVAR
jgi:hypothetical protein